MLYYIFPYLCCWIPMRSEPIIWNRWTLNEQNNFFLNTKQTHVCVLRTNACFDCDSLNIVIVRNATANIVLITKTKTNLYILIITIEYLSCINPLIMEWICAGMYDVFFYHQHIKRLKIHQTKNIRMCQLPIVITNTHTHTHSTIDFDYLWTFSTPIFHIMFVCLRIFFLIVVKFNSDWITHKNIQFTIFGIRYLCTACQHTNKQTNKKKPTKKIQNQKYSM